MKLSEIVHNTCSCRIAKLDLLFKKPIKTSISDFIDIVLTAFDNLDLFFGQPVQMVDQAVDFGVQLLDFLRQAEAGVVQLTLGAGALLLQGEHVLYLLHDGIVGGALGGVGKIDPVYRELFNILAEEAQIHGPAAF